MSEIKARLWAEIDHRRDELAGLCAAGLRVSGMAPAIGERGKGHQRGIPR